MVMGQTFTTTDWAVIGTAGVIVCGLIAAALYWKFKGSYNYHLKLAQSTRERQLELMEQIPNLELSYVDDYDQGKSGEDRMSETKEDGTVYSDLIKESSVQPYETQRSYSLADIESRKRRTRITQAKIYNFLVRCAIRTNSLKSVYNSEFLIFEDQEFALTILSEENDFILTDCGFLPIFQKLLLIKLTQVARHFRIDDFHDSLLYMERYNDETSLFWDCVFRMLHSYQIAPPIVISEVPFSEDYQENLGDMPTPQETPKADLEFDEDEELGEDEVLVGSLTSTEESSNINNRPSLSSCQHSSSSSFHGSSSQVSSGRSSFNRVDQETYDTLFSILIPNYPNYHLRLPERGKLHQLDKENGITIYALREKNENKEEEEKGAWNSGVGQTLKRFHFRSNHHTLIREAAIADIKRFVNFLVESFWTKFKTYSHDPAPSNQQYDEKGGELPRSTRDRRKDDEVISYYGSILDSEVWKLRCPKVHMRLEEGIISPDGQDLGDSAGVGFVEGEVRCCKFLDAEQVRSWIFKTILPKRKMSLESQIGENSPTSPFEDTKEMEKFWEDIFLDNFFKSLPLFIVFQYLFFMGDRRSGDIMVSDEGFVFDERFHYFGESIYDIEPQVEEMGRVEEVEEDVGDFLIKRMDYYKKFKTLLGNPERWEKVLKTVEFMYTVLLSHNTLLKDVMRGFQWLYGEKKVRGEVDYYDDISTNNQHDKQKEESFVSEEFITSLEVKLTEQMRSQCLMNLGN